MDRGPFRYSPHHHMERAAAAFSQRQTGAGTPTDHAVNLMDQDGLASPSFSTSAFSRVNVSCANFLYAAVLMYIGTMS